MTPHRIFVYAAPLIVFAAVFFGAVMLDDDHDCEAKTCPDCGGDGEVTCSSCNGNGYTSIAHSGSGEQYWETIGCTSCGGSGYQLDSFDGTMSEDGNLVFGSGKVTCSTCGGSGSVADPHTHSYSKTGSKYYTCGGWVYTYTCSCGDSYTTGSGYSSHNYVSDGGHWSGCKYYTDKKCSRCGDTTSTYSYTSHSWGSWTTTKAATCTSSGTQTRTCSDCGNTETQTISATGHSYVSHSAVSPTCTKSGNDAYYTCSKCSTIFNSSKTVISSIPTKAALGHSWGSWTVTKEATCTDSGTQKHTCSRCSSSETKTISSLGHQWYVTAYQWSDDCSECTVHFNCARNNSHSSTTTAESGCTETDLSAVKTKIVYSISGSDSYTGVAYSDSKILYDHLAILQYSASGASDVPSVAHKVSTTSSDTPSGSCAFIVGSAPSKSGKIFGTWSDGVRDYAPKSQISVPYGSIVELTAVWEDPIEFTTVPTASCVVTPVIDYSDDGSYTLQSAASHSLGSSMAASSDVWTDPNYRTPPEADHVIHLTDDLSFKSNDAAYSISWTQIDVSSGVDNVDAAKQLAYQLSYAVSGTKNWSYSVQECTPSWIHWDTDIIEDDLGHDVVGQFTLSIRPALQQISEDTHGDYWFWYAVTSPLDRTESFLIEFSVDVDWAGGVIVPEKYSTFVLRLDYGFDSGANNKTLRQICSADASEYRFNLVGTELARDGYTFKGWATTSGSGYTDIGEEYPLNIGSASVQKSVDDKGNPVYTATIYVVWEEIEKDDPVIPDNLRDLLGLLQDPYVLGLFVLICFLVAVIVRVRRQGMV